MKKLFIFKKNDNRLESIENDIEIKNQLNNNLSKIVNGDHIDFIERVYDNVKNPLGYLCNKLNFYTNSNDNYTLENVNSSRSDT